MSNTLGARSRTRLGHYTRKVLLGDIHHVHLGLVKYEQQMAPLLPAELLLTLTQNCPCRELQLRQLATLYNVSCRPYKWRPTTDLMRRTTSLHLQLLSSTALKLLESMLQSETSLRQEISPLQRSNASNACRCDTCCPRSS